MDGWNPITRFSPVQPIFLLDSAEMSRHDKRRKGFTLAELLISLAVLGLIAIFTIPKVLQSQQDEKYKAMAKEAASMVSSAYNIYRSKNTITSSTGFDDLTPYMNYVRLDTSSTVDINYENAGSFTCSAAQYCLRLHNGSMIVMGYVPVRFGGTSATNTLMFYIDPDGKLTDTAAYGSGKLLQFFLYINGRITTREGILSGTSGQGWGPAEPNTTSIPPWFSWD